MDVFKKVWYIGQKGYDQYLGTLDSGFLKGVGEALVSSKGRDRGSTMLSDHFIYCEHIQSFELGKHGLITKAKHSYQCKVGIDGVQILLKLLESNLTAKHSSSIVE